MGNRGTVTLHPFPPCTDAPNGGVTLTLDKVRPDVGPGQVYLTPNEAVALAHELLGCARQLLPALSFPPTAQRAARLVAPTDPTG
jgi:hypothetical protein